MNEDKQKLALCKNLSIVRAENHLKNYFFMSSTHKGAAMQVVMKALNDFILDVDSDLSLSEIKEKIQSTLDDTRKSNQPPLDAAKVVFYKNGTKSFFKKVNGTWFYSVENAWQEKTPKEIGMFIFWFFGWYVVHPYFGINRMININK